jgi:tRNA-dihydrouridine synthase A
MKAAVSVPVTVKCRLAVDDQDAEAALDALADAVLAAGADALWVHARKAWLSGLSPKENRDVPPLDYGRVYRLKARLGPGVFVGINGGIPSLAAAEEHLRHVDGVMLGRAAYHEPAILADVDQRLYGEPLRPVDLRAVAEAMIPEVEAVIARGGRAAQVYRHMIGLFHGRPGARIWRRILTVEGAKPGAGPEVLLAALDALKAPAMEAEAA